MATTDTNMGTTTNFEYIDLQRRDNVAVITLQRPDRLNALNRQMAQELHDTLDQLAGEFPEIRAVIITGAGRGFCSGADVGDMPGRMAEGGDRDPNNPDPGPSITMRLAPHLREIPQPVIAAMHGVAAGAGLGIAAEMSFTGRVYDAPWALSKGLVNDVFPDDELITQAEAMAQEIASNPPLAVKAIKGLFNVHHTSLNKVILAEHRANDPLRGTNDQTEAIQAFLEKRRPKFTGS